MNKDMITVYLLLKSKRELIWENLLEESGLDSEKLLRIVMLLQLKQYVKRVEDKYVFLGKSNNLSEKADHEILKCTDYYDERFKNEGETECTYRSLSDILESKFSKLLPLKVLLDGRTLQMNLVVNLDKGDGRIEILLGKSVLNIPHYIDSDSLMLDVYELFQFYKKYAEKEGINFLISRAYSLFHLVANCELGEEECKLSPCNNATQLEFDAASTCIQICQAITETLNIDSVTMTIDTITRASKFSSKGIEDLKKLEFLKKQEVQAAYTFPLSPFEIGILVMRKDGIPLCLLSGYNLFAKIPVRETENSLEIDFTYVVEKYAKNAERNNGNEALDVDKVSELFFSIFDEEKNALELEELLGQLKTREEMDLLNTMYLISSLTMENQTKEVSAKIRYKPPKIPMIIGCDN
ncbi:MAG: hypothetical protein WED07_16565 [Candidatus Freyarchaeum deiterrae]